MQKDEILGPNHNSAADCTPWDLSANGCRSDHQVVSSCHGLHIPKEHCQVLAFLSFHAESSAQLRQGIVVFSLKSTLKKLKQKKPKKPTLKSLKLTAFTPWAEIRQNYRKDQAPVDTPHVCTHHSH